MAKHEWCRVSDSLKDDAEPIMRNIIQQAGGFEVAIALYRKNDHRRANAKTNPYALAAWCWRVLGLANSQGFSTQYEAGSLSEPVLREIAQLSPAPDGPLKAREYLAELGIPLVTLRHLSKTHLDGAALKATDGRPVVGLTIRHDRLDNFWYTLLHELAHVHLHFDDDQDETYVDDLMLVNQGDPKEEAADAMASRSLIPEHLRLSSLSDFGVHFSHPTSPSGNVSVDGYVNKWLPVNKGEEHHAIGLDGMEITFTFVDVISGVGFTIAHTEPKRHSCEKSY